MVNFEKSWAKIPTFTKNLFWRLPLRLSENRPISIRAEIEETKQELVEAKLVRKNRMEYDALAKVSLGSSSSIGNIKFVKYSFLLKGEMEP